MAEEAVTEPTTTEEATQEAPTNEFGAGFLSDKAPGESEDVGGEPEDSPEEEQEATPQPEADLTKLGIGNITEAQLRDLQNGHLRQSDYTRKTQDLSDERKKLEASQQEFLAKQQEFQDAQQALLQPQQQTQSQSANLRQMLQNTPAQSDANPQGLSAADRQGYEYLASVLEQNETLRTDFSALKEQLDKLSPQIEETSGSVSQLTEAQNNARVEAYRQQAKEADELFGEGSTQKYGQFIVTNLGQINEATGKEYTISELVGMKSGKTAEEAAKARAGNRGTRRRQQTRVAPVSQPGLTESEGEYQSEAQAIAEISKTM